MKKFILFIYFHLMAVICLAQQEPLYSRYMFSMLTINPAYAGNRDVLSICSMYRKQWVQLNGSPETMTFTMDTPFSNEKMGAGLTLSKDKAGIFQTVSVIGNYAYRIHLSSKGTLAAGVSGGLYNYNANFSSLDFSRTNFSQVDDPAFSVDLNKTMPNVGVGLFYSTDKFYIGFSMPKTLRNNLSYNSPVQVTGTSRYYFLTSGYVFKLNEIFKLKPSFQLRSTSGAPIQLDLNSNLWINDKVSFGISYRTSSAIIGMLELQLNPQFRFGYAYDKSINKARSTLSGSHEVFLRYEFGYDKTNVRSPRYF